MIIWGVTAPLNNIETWKLTSIANLFREENWYLIFLDTLHQDWERNTTLIVFKESFSIIEVSEDILCEEIRVFQLTYNGPQSVFDLTQLFLWRLWQTSPTCVVDLEPQNLAMLRNGNVWPPFVGHPVEN